MNITSWRTRDLKPADVVPQMGHMIPDDFFTGFGATQAMVVSMAGGPVPVRGVGHAAA